MKITVQITVQSDEGQAEVVEVARLERRPLRPETLGMSLAEARAILAGLEHSLVERQAAEFLAQQGRRPHCGRERSCKDRQSIVFRTPFGKLKVAGPRLYRCRCESDPRESFSPLAERLPERTSPELAYLETKFAALLSFGLTLKLLKEVLPIGQNLSATAIQNQVRRTAERLEAERGEGQRQDVLVEDCLENQDALPKPAVPRVVGLDGVYVHARDQRSRTEGWFEVIVGKSMATEGQASKCFGFVSRYEPEPKGCLFEWLKTQGLQSNQAITFSVGRR